MKNGAFSFFTTIVVVFEKIATEIFVHVFAVIHKLFWIFLVKFQCCNFVLMLVFVLEFFSYFFNTTLHGKQQLKWIVIILQNSVIPCTHVLCTHERNRRRNRIWICFLYRFVIHDKRKFWVNVFNSWVLMCTQHSVCTHYEYTCVCVYVCCVHNVFVYRGQHCSRMIIWLCFFLLLLRLFI